MKVCISIASSEPGRIAVRNEETGEVRILSLPDRGSMHFDISENPDLGLALHVIDPEPEPQS